jgi:hypothetical protein
VTKASDNPYPSLLIVEGSAPTSPSAGNQRLFIDSADHAVKVKNSGGTVTAVGGTGTGGGGLLAYAAYAPGGENTYTTTSGTLADVDATNLQITFTAPASGNVLVLLHALTAAVADVAFGLREATSTVGTHQLVTASVAIVAVTAHLYVTGVSGGSHTYKFAWMTEGGGLATIYYGGSFRGPITMEVWSAP